MSVSVSSKRYAQAIFQIAKEDGEFDKWQSDLMKLAELMQDSELVALVESPKLLFEMKAKLVQERLDKINPLALNLAYLLITKNKFKNAGQIAKEYGHLLDDYHGIKRAEITTAIPLDSSDRNQFGQRLETLIDSKVSIDFIVDPDILGGFIARVNGSLIDGSVRNRLELLKKNLVETEK